MAGEEGVTIKDLLNMAIAGQERAIGAQMTGLATQVQALQVMIREGNGVLVARMDRDADERAREQDRNERRWQESGDQIVKVCDRIEALEEFVANFRGGKGVLVLFLGIFGVAIVGAVVRLIGG